MGRSKENIEENKNKSSRRDKTLNVNRESSQNGDTGDEAEDNLSHQRADIGNDGQSREDISANRKHHSRNPNYQENRAKNANNDHSRANKYSNGPPVTSLENFIKVEADVKEKKKRKVMLYIIKFLIRFVIMGIGFLIAVISPSFVKFISLVGSFVFSTMGFVFPVIIILFWNLQIALMKNII